MRIVLRAKAAILAARRAWKGGLITFEKKFAGARCTDCIHVDAPKDYCNYRLIDQRLVDGHARMCCNHYDTPKMKRLGEA